MKILIYILLGAIAGIIAVPLSKLWKGEKKTWSVLFFIIMGLFTLLAKFYLIPQYEIWDIKREIVEIPVYKLISETDPQTFNLIIDDFYNFHKKNKNYRQLNLATKQNLEMVLAKYAPITSNRSINEYVEILLRELKVLNRKDSKLCFGFLFPKEFGPIKATKYFDKSLQEEDLNALAKVIRDALNTPQEPPNPQESDRLFQELADQMYRAWGKDTQILEGPPFAGAGPKKVCDIYIDMIETILKLPPEKRSVVLRSFFSL